MLAGFFWSSGDETTEAWRLQRKPYTLRRRDTQAGEASATGSAAVGTEGWRIR